MCEESVYLRHATSIKRRYTNLLSRVIRKGHSVDILSDREGK